MDLMHYGSHTDHLHQQHESTPTPPPAPASTHKPLAEVLEEESATKPPSFFLPLSLPNGTLKKHRQEPPPPPPPPLAWSRPHSRHDRRKDHVVYRECMKNHAAALGGHALDGCGEFMSSPASNTSAPGSLTCAACGCHRNFHRRLLQYYNDEREEGEVEERDDDDVVEGLCRPSPPPPPPRKGAGFYQYSSSAAPHRLMALSAGYHGTVQVIRPSGSTTTPPAAAGTTAASAGAPSTGVVAIRTVVLPAGKRFRTKFTPEQKAGMQELCEQLGWRMQRRDDALLEQRCREIGVSRGVFKVWIHNNKHAFVGGPSSRRGGGGGAVAGAGGGSTGADGGGGGSCVVSVNGDSGNGGSTGHAVDGSPVSS